MKKKICLIALILGLIFCSFSLVGCGSSVAPYVGEWVTAYGEVMSLSEGGNFKSTISNVTVYGTYTVYLNTLIIDNETSESKTYCEWDVRGNSLYLIYDTYTVQFFYKGEAEE